MKEEKHQECEALGVFGWLNDEGTEGSEAQL